jgi:hypothetical protein
MTDPHALPSVAAYHAARDANPTLASHLLFSWLCDDGLRELLYQDMDKTGAALAFESRALNPEDDQTGHEDGPKAYRQTAYLVATREHLDLAYTQSSRVPDESLLFSNTPFQGLGGTFMLAIDEPPASPAPSGGLNFKSHDVQRHYCFDHLEALEPFFDPIATIAFKTGALLPLKSRQFDLALLAEQVSVRFVAMVFGFPQTDLPMLAETGRKIGRGLQYQMMARHFVTEPSAIIEAKQALGRLSTRAAELIDLYTVAIGEAQIDQLADIDKERDELREVLFENPDIDNLNARPQDATRKVRRLQAFVPMLRTMAAETQTYSTTEKAILVAGLIGGAVTNIRAAICIAVNAFFKLDPAARKPVTDAATDAWLAHRDAHWGGDLAENFRKYVEEAMRVTPPAAFVPRRAAQALTLPGRGGHPACHIPPDSLIVLGVGGGTWTNADTAKDLRPGCPVTGAGHHATPAAGAARFDTNVTVSDPLSRSCPFNHVFGGPPDVNLGKPLERAVFTHSCIGKDFAMYVITHTVRQLMILPGLTQALDDKTAAPKGLTKRWGYYCESYPLEYQREKLLRQAPLQTVLQVKNPVPEHAEALKQVLTFGAAFIEKVLQDARHVHFASFIFLDNDSKLVLFTAFDGDFDAYIGHFAREFGPLFDRFFSHIEDGPPAPIREHAFEFVQFLRRFQKPSAGGYFFSAYPEVQAAQIKWQFNPSRQYDLFDVESRHD